MCGICRQQEPILVGLVIAKFKAFGGLHHECFSKLYDTMVDSVISYGSPIWGYKSYSIVNAIQNSARRFILGLWEWENIGLHQTMQYKEISVGVRRNMSKVAPCRLHVYSVESTTKQKKDFIIKSSHGPGD